MQKKPERDRKIKRGGERVLLVDDEEPMLRLQSEVLEYLDYKVFAASSAHEALKEFKRDPLVFDLVITDQTMPEISGLKFAEELLKVRSDIPIILCTGFSPDLEPGKVKDKGIRRMVMKPLSIQDWAQTIRETLDNEDEE